jgi:hypothetical protein
MPPPDGGAAGLTPARPTPLRRPGRWPRLRTLARNLRPRNQFAIFAKWHRPAGRDRFCEYCEHFRQTSSPGPGAPPGTGRSGDLSREHRLGAVEEVYPEGLQNLQKPLRRDLLQVLQVTWWLVSDGNMKWTAGIRPIRGPPLSDCDSPDPTTANGLNSCSRGDKP